jgi:2-polyprenyl-3-methyl-5-hydroxy-6-metoxy-1,4-benzoquinol methylase
VWGLVERLKYFLNSLLGISAMQERITFLLGEVDRLNETMRRKELGADIRTQTRSSFDYQWHEFNSGVAMADDESYMKECPSLICTMTDLPPDWFVAKRALDIGCGAGRFSYGLLSLGASVTACDQSEWALRKTDLLCGGQSNRFSTMKIDILKWDEPADYDLVFCFGVVHHTGDTYRAIVNVANKVKPGGRLFLMVYGNPVADEDFRELNSYEALRRELRNVPFEKKKALLLERFGAYLGHGWFDAVSPRINDILSFQEIEELLMDLGFADIRRTMAGRNHHIAAEKTA